MIMMIPVLYYLAGLAWLSHGLVTGWLNYEGHPAAVALWVAVGAAVWPWFIIKILWDLYHGRGTTNLQ